MPKDFIKINREVTTATHAQELLALVRTYRESWEQGQKVLAIMQHNTVASDFADIESLFGIPIGQGQTVLQGVQASVTAMDPSFKTITDRLG